jgi:hypothetical protein
VRTAVGSSVGAAVGEGVGSSVGVAVGNDVGAGVGAAVGSNVGDAVGPCHHHGTQCSLLPSLKDISRRGHLRPWGRPWGWVWAPPSGSPWGTAAQQHHTHFSGVCEATDPVRRERWHGPPSASLSGWRWAQTSGWRSVPVDTSANELRRSPRPFMRCFTYPRRAL